MRTTEQILEEMKRVGFSNIGWRKANAKLRILGDELVTDHGWVLNEYGNARPPDAVNADPEWGEVFE